MITEGHDQVVYPSCSTELGQLRWRGGDGGVINIELHPHMVIRLYGVINTQMELMDLGNVTPKPLPHSPCQRL